MENIRERIRNLECLVNGLELKTLKKHIKNLENRVRKVEEFETRLKDLEIFATNTEFIEANLTYLSKRVSDLENKPQEELLKYVAKQIIEEAEMSDMPFEDMWERIGSHFCDRYESKITQMTEEFQRNLSMVCLARMELITQSTISKLEKFSNEAIEIIKNKESKNNE